MHARYAQVVSIVAISVLAPTLASCSDRKSPTEDAAKPGQVTTVLPATIASQLGDIPDCSGKRLGVILKTLNNEHWQEMKSAYEAHGKALGLQVVVQAAQSETDQTGQLTAASAMANQNYDVFALSPITANNLSPFVRQLKQKGTPSIEVDTGDVADATIYVGPDNVVIGSLAGQAIAKALPNGGKVAQIEGLPGLPATRDRIAGFKQSVKDAGNLDLVASVPADYDREKAITTATAIMQAHPDVKAIYANNDTMALGVVQALQQLGLSDQVMVFGTDGIPDAIEAVRSKKLTGTVAAFPGSEGEMAAEVACRLVAGQKVPHAVQSRTELITGANVDAEFPK